MDLNGPKNLGNIIIRDKLIVYSYMGIVLVNGPTENYIFSYI